MEGYETKRTLQCGGMMESQYFIFAKKCTNQWSVNICCMCASDEALLSVDKMKENFPQVGGRQNSSSHVQLLCRVGYHVANN